MVLCGPCVALANTGGDRIRDQCASDFAHYDCECLARAFETQASAGVTSEIAGLIEQRDNYQRTLTDRSFVPAADDWTHGSDQRRYYQRIERVLKAPAGPQRDQSLENMYVSMAATVEQLSARIERAASGGSEVPFSTTLSAVANQCLTAATVGLQEKQECLRRGVLLESRLGEGQTLESYCACFGARMGELIAANPAVPGKSTFESRKRQAGGDCRGQ